MALIKTHIKPDSEKYKSNFAHHSLLGKDLESKLDTIKRLGPPKRVEKHRSRGKMTARERIEYLLDRGADQIEIGADIITEMQSKFLKENDIITIQLYGSQPVSIILPDHVSFAVVETETVIKGQTAASSYKPAVLERNIKTSVPPFIEVGDIVVINTLNSNYVEKAKK